MSINNSFDKILKFIKNESFNLSVIILIYLYGYINRIIF